MTPSPNPQLNVLPGTIFHMDNLVALRGINSSTIDLIATDPPFNTGRNRMKVGGEYVDQWRWDVNVHRSWMDDMRDGDDKSKAVVKVIESAHHAHTPNLSAFLCMLGIRQLEKHRVLKDTGIVCVHLNHVAGHYVKAIMDAVFGHKNFINEIVWRKYAGRKNNAKIKLSTQHEVILVYSKAKDGYTFNKLWVPHSAKEIEKEYKEVDEDGRRFRYSRGRSYQLHGIQKKLYLDESPGRARGTLWVEDGLQLNTSSNERTGYPDQKPVALYELLVECFSNPDDLILDPFCGCGTTPVAAQNLGRRWIGIDSGDDARAQMLCRFAGIKKDEVERIREQTRDTDPGYIDRQLEKHGAVFTTDPPVRTDGGGNAAPYLEQVKGRPSKALFTKPQIKQMLFDQFGHCCWGCGWDPRAGDNNIRYLELDRIRSGDDGGEYVLDNCALLCGPCNNDKSSHASLSTLRIEKHGGLKKAKAAHPDLKLTVKWAKVKIREAQKSRDRKEAPLFNP